MRNTPASFSRLLTYLIVVTTCATAAVAEARDEQQRQAWDAESFAATSTFHSEATSAVLARFTDTSETLDRYCPQPPTPCTGNNANPLEIYAPDPIEFSSRKTYANAWRCLTLILYSSLGNQYSLDPSAFGCFFSLQDAFDLDQAFIGEPVGNPGPRNFFGRGVAIASPPRGRRSGKPYAIARSTAALTSNYPCDTYNRVYMERDRLDQNCPASEQFTTVQVVDANSQFRMGIRLRPRSQLPPGVTLPEMVEVHVHLRGAVGFDWLSNKPELVDGPATSYASGRWELKLTDFNNIIIGETLVSHSFDQEDAYQNCEQIPEFDCQSRRAVIDEVIVLDDVSIDEQYVIIGEVETEMDHDEILLPGQGNFDTGTATLNEYAVFDVRASLDPSVSFPADAPWAPYVDLLVSPDLFAPELVDDLRPGESGSEPVMLAVQGDSVLFEACVLGDPCFGTRHKDGVYAYEAGAGQPIKVMSQAEVLRLKDAGASHSGFLYALGPDGIGPIGELWAYTPGAAAPRFLDVDLLCTPQIVYSTGSQFTATSLGAFYAANDGRVCFTQGTAGTTQVVANPFDSTNPDDNSTVAVFLGRVGEMLFFCTTPQGGPYCSELRVAESTPGNARLIDTPELFSIIRAVVVDEHLLFTGARCPGGSNCQPAIWVSDGSSGGTTTLVVDNPESRPIELGHLDSLGEVALFRTEPTINQRAYWITDGTQDGTQLLETLPAAGFINPLAIHNGFLYYGRHPGDGSQQFWRTTGSAADATEVSAPWTDEGKNHTISHAQTSNGFLAYIRANKVWLMSEESTHFPIFEPGQGGQAHQLLAGETTLFMSLKEGGETVQPPPESDENTELLAGLELLDFAEDDVGWELFQFVTDAPGFLSSEPIVSDESGPLSGPELLIGNVSFADSFE